MPSEAETGFLGHPRGFGGGVSDAGDARLRGFDHRAGPDPHARRRPDNRRRAKSALMARASCATGRASATTASWPNTACRPAHIPTSRSIICPARHRRRRLGFESLARAAAKHRADLERGDQGSPRVAHARADLRRPARRARGPAHDGGGLGRRLRAVLPPPQGRWSRDESSTPTPTSCRCSRARLSIRWSPTSRRTASWSRSRFTKA